MVPGVQAASDPATGRVPDPFPCTELEPCAVPSSTPQPITARAWCVQRDKVMLAFSPEVTFLLSVDSSVQGNIQCVTGLQSIIRGRHRSEGVRGDETFDRKVKG
ncbi:hypothetical protein NDU88_001202 [Pleurodeles waltl]|uniref:Uncharacterized protein n=1 Tax=Pleurodeles waltl TaxID=8319 RepID=A0AAV7LZT8_PLEWA|nr:hypothetical protein NDU88_001202 [Pleurodeles waltl]